MSGEYPSGGSGGWNHGWFPSPSSFGGGSSSSSPDTNFSPPPPTQTSGIPGGGYRPYPVDMPNAPEGQFGWTPEYGSTQPLSQLPEGHNSGSGSSCGGGRAGGGGDPNVRTPYTPREVQKLFEAYVSVTEDPAIGTNQTGETFWGRIADIYNAGRPAGTVERNESMLRNAFKRADIEIKKFQGYFLEEERSAGSGGNEADVLTAALAAYATTHHKQFKHTNTWRKVRHLPRWRGGIESSSGSSGKRSRSQSDFGEDEVASQLAGAQLGSSDADAGPSRSRRRPTGQKKAKASRRHDAAPAPPPAPFVPPPPPAMLPNPNTLYTLLDRAIHADMTNMTPEQRAANARMIQSLESQLAMLMNPNRPPPSA